MNITVNDSLWRKVAFACINAMSWLVIAFGTAGILYADWHAALSGVGAIVIVAFFSWVSVALTDVTSRRAPGLVMAVAMSGFVLKLIAFAVILTVFEAPFWLQPAWAAAGAIGAIILWQAVEVIVFLRHRQLIYD